MSEPAPAREPGRRPVVLVMMGSDWPGHDSSGPNHSFRAMCRALGAEFDFRAVAPDRPIGAAEPLIDAGSWRPGDHCQRYYSTLGPFTARGLYGILKGGDYDLLMINSLFDRRFSVLPLVMRRLGMLARRPAILSPRGEFASGAFGLKGLRKRVWLAVIRYAGLLSDIWLHATSEGEAQDIERRFPYSKGVLRAQNVRALPPPVETDFQPGDGAVRLAFVGRINPVKNVDVALEALRTVKTPVQFDLYGPISDAIYWAACEKIIATLPAHVTVTRQGEVSNAEVRTALAGYDLLFLPTKGENFGHAIFEALSAGCPALISDQTPWKNLEALEAGWSLPLGDPARFADAIDRYAGMSAAQKLALRRGARRLAEDSVVHDDSVTLTRAMLERALGG